MELRTATPTDAESMARCIVASWLDAHRGQIPAHLWERRRKEWMVSDSAAAWERTLSEISSDTSARSHIFVATESGEVVGLVMGTVGPDSRGAIDALYVVSGCQGRGVGRRLLSASLDAFRSADVSGVEVVVLAANKPARRFYEALGGSYLGPTELDEEGELLPGAIYEWPPARKPA
jgi:ribosomal protein S18 acetylase RimI-like enzyme